MRSTFVLEDANGNEVASIQEKMLHIKDTMEIERGGRKIATVKKALISPLRDRFDVAIEGGADWDVQGNIVNHEYAITSGRDEVAEVSMKWFRVRDTYGIEVTPGQDVGLVWRSRWRSTRCSAVSHRFARLWESRYFGIANNRAAGAAMTEQGEGKKYERRCDGRAGAD